MSLITLIGFMSSAAPAAASSCALAGTWRVADTNPSAGYIVDKRQIRFSVAPPAADGSHEVACVAGACPPSLAPATLRVAANGTIVLTPATDPRAAAPAKCPAVRTGADWCLGASNQQFGCGEKYSIQAGSAGKQTDPEFSVRCKKGKGSPCSSWQTATGSLDVASQR